MGSFCGEYFSLPPPPSPSRSAPDCSARPIHFIIHGPCLCACCCVRMLRGVDHFGSRMHTGSAARTIIAGRFVVFFLRRFLCACIHFGAVTLFLFDLQSDRLIVLEYTGHNIVRSARYLVRTLCMFRRMALTVSHNTISLAPWTERVRSRTNFQRKTTISTESAHSPSSSILFMADFRSYTRAAPIGAYNLREFYPFAQRVGNCNWRCCCGMCAKCITNERAQVGEPLSP